MIWELIGTGHLAHWWEYVMLVACILVLAGGPVLIWGLWVTSPRRGGKWWLASGTSISGSRPVARNATARPSTGPRCR